MGETKAREAKNSGIETEKNPEQKQEPKKSKGKQGQKIEPKEAKNKQEQKSEPKETEQKPQQKSKPGEQDIRILKEKIEAPMRQLTYQYAIDVVLAKLRLIDAQLSGKSNRPLVRTFSSRIKTTDSIVKKLIRKGREVSYQTAVDTLNDIAGVRVVCYFFDDIYRIAEQVRRQKDIKILKEKDYAKKPKKSGYQSLHLIVEVPVVYGDKTQNVRVEIQIRSVAMDYWAELDTQMCYKKDAGQLEAVEKATREYADVIAGVDKKMLELRKKIQKM